MKELKYNPQKIEKKWQKYWQEKNFYQAKDFSKKPKQYLLVEFPYPSGQGLHVGHCRSYTAMDIIARKRRMAGFNVLFPIGWDAFGLPTENYALKTGIHPQTATQRNIKNFKRQLKSLGLSFDWSREINTTEPRYYKWTQWIFLQLFKKGLAYQAEIPINWCPKCKIGLANEEVINGRHERCGEKVVQKTKKQWLIKITAYADRLIEDLKKVNYLEKIKNQQINWIGRSEGTEVDFKIEKINEIVKVFTTRVDTIFGVVALVLAPEHKIINKLLPLVSNSQEVKKYIQKTKEKSEFERTQLEKERTGVPLKGIFAENPLTSEKIPLWLADYVIGTYGGGAVMVVPAHDKRDFDFAKKYNLKIKEVIKPIQKRERNSLPFVEEGRLVNSGQFSGLTSQEAKEKITQYLTERNLGRKSVQYKLRDWIFSRQHYWGEPIPIIHCPKCGAIPVPEKNLPVKLPYLKKYQVTETGESPLANAKQWLKVKCPKCGSPAKRETDTMPNWAGSNWYYIRYLDPKNNKEIANPKKIKYWLPVDWYNGGMEHTTLHLLYSRFIYKFLYDLGVVFQEEPYQKRTSHGIVLAEDGRKMSKSFGNVVNPDEIVKKYGADTLRVYEMFMGPFDQAIAWSSQSVRGVRRFLDKLWQLVLTCQKNKNQKNKKSSQEAIRRIHQLNKKVEEDIEKMRFNTSISSFMEFVNFALENKEEIGKEVIERLLILFAPFAPHLTEELWHQLGKKSSIHNQSWPKYEPKLIEEKKIVLVIQINGKLRDKIEVEKNISKEEAIKIALSQEKVKKHLTGKKIKKEIFVPGKLINFVAQ